MWSDSADGNYNGRTTGGFTISNRTKQLHCIECKTAISARSSLLPILRRKVVTILAGHRWHSSGTEFYGSTGIPGWQNSLLAAMLKSGTITRFKLSNDGLSIISDTINYFRGKGRFRDVVVSPDGLKIYVACDSSGSSHLAPPAELPPPAPIREAFLNLPMYHQYRAGEYRDIRCSRDRRKYKESLDRCLSQSGKHHIIVYNYETTGGRKIELTDMNGRMVRKNGSNKPCYAYRNDKTFQTVLACWEWSMATEKLSWSRRSFIQK